MTTSMRNLQPRAFAQAAAVVLLLSLVAAGDVSSGGRLQADEPASAVRVGMIGLDTSHVILFTKLLNNPNASGDLAGAKVVAAYPGGSPDLPLSRDRVQGFTEQLRKMGVTMVDSIEELLPKVDAVMLESVDGRPHLKQAAPVIRAGKRLFIDKPVAASLADVIAIFRLANDRHVPCFSCSSNRFATPIQAVRSGQAKIGRVCGCDIYGPCSPLSFHPNLYFYGIHGVEMLYTVMGPGCVSVSCVETPSTFGVTGVWKDGRVGTYRGIRPNGGTQQFGGMVFGSKGIVSVRDGGEDEALMRELVKFFKTGKPPVSAEETIEIFAFMDAAEESMHQAAKPAAVAEIIEKAQKGAPQPSAKN
jgi:predicted dehydrogenase